MKAVILAGGLGTRLRAVTGEHPKPLAPLLGRPVMEHIVELLRDQGFTEICAALHYRAGKPRHGGQRQKLPGLLRGRGLPHHLRRRRLRF